MDIKEVLNLKDGSVVKFTLNEKEHILAVWDGELFIQPTGVLATNLFLLKTLIISSNAKLVHPSACGEPFTNKTFIKQIPFLFFTFNFIFFIYSFIFFINR